MRTFVCLALAAILLVAGSSAATYDAAAQLLDVDAGVQAPSAARQVRQGFGGGFGGPGGGFGGGGFGGPGGGFGGRPGGGFGGGGFGGGGFRG